jgi:phosphatidylglycerol lysyltransferase
MWVWFFEERGVGGSKVAGIAERERARALVMAHGWNATAYQILNPGMGYWFSRKAAGVAGYVARGRRWVVAGGPVCAEEDLGVVTAELEGAARGKGKRVCYVAAGERLEAFFEGSAEHSRVTLGAQPVWEPAGWRAIVKERSSLRQQLSRARNKGVAVAVKAATALREDAGLRGCLKEWLAARLMPPLHFLVEPATYEGELADRLLLVAEMGGKAVGFLLASPIPQRGGFLVEQIVRGEGAPNGTAELLIDGMMGELVRRGSGYVTMGMVPLTEHAKGWMAANPWWMRLMMTWAKAHGRRFYRFDGLEQFREKMRPARWEPIYAISNERRFSPASAAAMMAAFSEGALVGMVARALGRAVATEVGRALKHET